MFCLWLKLIVSRIKKECFACAKEKKIPLLFL